MTGTVDNSIQVARFKRVVSGDSVVWKPESKKIVADINPLGTGDVTSSFPYFSPTKEKFEAGEVRLFPESVSEVDLEYRFRRWALVKAIVNDVPEDAMRRGFTILNLVDKGDEDMNAKFQTVYSNKIKSPFLRALKYSRHYGFTDLYFGYKDAGADGKDGLAVPPRNNPQIDFIEPFRKPEITLYLSETLPKHIEKIEIKTSAEAGALEIHPTRIIHIENEALSRNREGMSALEPVWDLLSIQKNAEWAMGQDMWRGAAGLLTLYAAEGAKPEDAIAALAAIENLHAKSRIVLPPGWKAEQLSPTRVAYNIKAMYEIIVSQISAGTRIPSSVLNPYRQMKDTGALTEYNEFLFTYKTIDIGPILKRVFRRFQKSGQLPQGDFEIIWTATEVSPYEAAKATYMEVIGERLKQKNELELAKAALVVKERTEEVGEEAAAAAAAGEEHIEPEPVTAPAGGQTIQ